MTTTSTKKALMILDLFRGTDSDLTTEEIASALQVPISTCYRYLKVMSDQGFLVSTSGSGYSLGPKIILLGYHLQRNDPVISAANTYADNIVKRFKGTATINRAFRQSFICIYVKHSVHETRTGFGAGDAMPILSGANAMLIQAFLSRHLQKKLYSEKAAELAAAGRGSNFEEFKQGLQAIRQARVSVAHGVVRSDSTGIAAPLLGPKNQILGTFSFSILNSDLTQEIEEALKLRVHEVGIRVSQILQREA